MKTRKKLIFRMAAAIVAISSILIFVPWDMARAYFKPLPETVSEQVGNAIDLGLDGIVVYIEKNGHEPKFYSSGWKNREDKIPSDPKALFKIASISKLYIAAAVTKLVNSQVLSLDHTLEYYLPSIAGRIENADQITLRMLLQHRSGIPNFTDDSEFPWFDPYTNTAEILELILDDPADFKPDRRYRYSNTNYLLIGNIIDDTLGYSHRQYIKNEILAPLNLNRTFGSLSEVNLEELTSGYYTEYDGDIKTLNFVSPSGSMVSTVEDVGIFLRALNTGSLFNDAEQAIYTSIYVYEHTGLLPGYSSIARYYKDIDTVVIQFVNTNGGNSWTMTEIVYSRIVRILRKLERPI